MQEAVSKGDTAAYKQERHKQRQEARDGRTRTQTPTKSDHAPTGAQTKPAASEPAAPAVEKPRKNADTRVQELLRERDQERRQWAQEKRELEARMSKPAAPEKPASQSQATRPKPSEDEIGTKYENYGAYVEDLADWKHEQREAQAQQSRTAEREQRELYARAESFEAEVSQFADRVTEWRTKNPAVQLEERLLAIPTASGLELFNATVPANERVQIGPEHFVVDLIRRSEIPGPLLAHFSDGREFKRLYDLAVRDAQAAVREMGRIEAKLLSAQAPPAASPAARVSAVPAPPTTLGKKPAGALDPLQKAIEAGDTNAYKAIRHQQRSGLPR